MKVMIHLTYESKKGLTCTLTSDFIDGKEAILIAEDMDKTGRVKSLTLSDSLDRTWNLKELKNYLAEVETEPHQIKVYFDGGYYRKTKEAGLGIVIYYEQNNKKYRIRKNTLIEGLVSNNDAEYAALHLAIKELDLMGVHHMELTIVGDSMVAINQLNEAWPCYEPELLSWLDKIENQLKQMGIKANYELVKRNENKEADQLATQALNGIEINSTKELK